MKKKILLMITLLVTLFWSTKVDAKAVTKDEIENNSYVIGNYYFTRTANAENNYEGKLTTQEIMLAAGTIDGDLDDMTIYYKNFLGNWINGLTGESITPPSVFEIKNRNLKDIIPNPELDCSFEFLSYYEDYLQRLSHCSIYVNENYQLYYHYYGSLIGANTSNLPDGMGSELYLLKTDDGSLPTEDAYYDPLEGVFKTATKTLKIEEYDGGVLTPPKDNEPLYQIVGRFYYLDGEEKIYSEYSNINTNGAAAIFGIDIGSTRLTLDATINDDYQVKVDSSLGYFGAGINGEVNYYNVKFNIGNVPDGYMVRNYKVYSTLPADESINYKYHDYREEAENGSDTLEYLYMESLAKQKYINRHRLAGMTVNTYLIAEVDGMNAHGEYIDVSEVEALSKRLYIPDDEEDDVSRFIVARVTICNENQTHCYRTTAFRTSAGDQSYVR